MTLAEALRKLHAAGKVASPWLPGMLVRYNLHLAQPPIIRLSYAPDYGWPELRNEHGVPMAYGPAMHAPWGEVADAEDPATRGCLLALLREATGDPWVHTLGQFVNVGDEPSIRHWKVIRGSGWWMSSAGHHATEADALVAALVAMAAEVQP